MRAMTCAYEGCPESPKTRRLCERHYRRRLHTGRFGYRDATPVRAHVLALRGLGWTYTQIAVTAGVSNWVPHKLAHGTTRRVLEETERKLLAVPLGPVESHRGVDGTGTFRRVEALQWLGWPMADLGRRLGLKPYTLSTLRSRGEPVSYRVALAVRELYDQLSHLPGPSKQTATKARNSGYAPPLAWDDETIDDPAAEPEGGERVETGGPRKLPPDDDLLFLLESETVWAVAARFGVSRHAVEAASAKARERAA